MELATDEITINPPPPHEPGQLWFPTNIDPHE